MPANYVLLEKVVVGAAGVASVTFNSIPQTGYTDLVLVTSTRSNTAEDAFSVRINNDSATNYTNVQINGSGSTAATSSFTQGAVGGGRQPESGYTANTFGNCRFYFPNYTSSANKSVSVEAVNENNATAVRTQFTSSVYPQTTPISSLVVVTGSGLFVQHSTFTLYGVAKFAVTPVIAPFATGGDVIQTDGTYWYHAFLSSGTFTPLKALSCDVLVVAGGGAGGYRNNGGGGGAGGVLGFASQSLASGTGYTATIGGGGSGTSQGSGSNSSFASLTASVGGGGGGTQSGTANGSNGGSGGGAGWTGTFGTATSGQGNNGGTANNGTYLAMGGGGGKGSVGGNGNPTTGEGGRGGDGVNTVTNWGALSSALTNLGLGVSGYIAGGGGGSSSLPGGTGSAGSGGGTGGSYSTASTSATANTGSGAGGVNITSLTTGNGGSGLVIIRYPMV